MVPEREDGGELKMDYKQAINHTINKKGMKQSMSGFLGKCSKIIEKADPEYESYSFVLDEISDHYKQAREAWLNNDLETVAEFFGLYV